MDDPAAAGRRGRHRGAARQDSRGRRGRGVDSPAMPDSPLITVDELLARLGDPALRIADVRWWLADPGKGRRDYEAAHLPGAIFVDVDRDLVGPSGPGRHPLPGPTAFAERLAALGFDD